MRVGMMMRDAEYRDALIEIMSASGKDIFIEVAAGRSVSRESVILTDIMPEEIEAGSLEKIKRRTVFLSPVPPGGQHHDRSGYNSGTDKNNGCRIVFKYAGFAEIMAEISLAYSEWTGDTGSISSSTRIIAVTGESDLLSSERCRSLAKQIIYRRGGSVLILPLSFINDYRSPTSESRGRFRRLMYMIDEGKDYLPGAFTCLDSFGIEYLLLPAGINPLTALTTDYLSKLISSLCLHFDTVILDIGTCYSSKNIRLIQSADNILFFGSGRRIEDIGMFTGEQCSGRITKIGISDAGREALSLDDFVRETYGGADQTKDDH